MSLSQEQPPLDTEDNLREFLGRRFIDISVQLDEAPRFPERKGMPYKPTFGNVYYFGDPVDHNYDAIIVEEGWWGWIEDVPNTDPITGHWTQLNLDTRVSQNEFELAVIQAVINEEAVLFKNTAQSLASGATVTLYDDSKDIDIDANITNDLALGIITIGVNGWYEVSGYIEATGSNNSAFYGSQVDYNNGANQLVMGVVQWNNATPGMGLSASAKIEMFVGDVIKMVAYASAGTLDVGTATLSAKMTSIN